MRTLHLALPTLGEIGSSNEVQRRRTNSSTGELFEHFSQEGEQPELPAAAEGTAELHVQTPCCEGQQSVWHGGFSRALRIVGQANESASAGCGWKV